MFWVISIYFNIRNSLPKSGTFLLGHPVYPRIFDLSVEAFEQEIEKRPDIPLDQSCRFCSYLSVPYHDSAKSLRSNMVIQMLFV